MSILFLGGDKRQGVVRDYLLGCGVDSETWLGETPFEDIKRSISSFDTIIFPLPVSTDGITLNISGGSAQAPKISEILSYIYNGSLIIGGKFTPAIKAEIDKKGIRYVDYYENEDFQIKNALLSAEGAIYVAMERLTRSLFGSKIAVVGFGRIGKLLSLKLKALDSDVTVCARKASDVAWAESLGYKAKLIQYKKDISTLSELCDGYDVIFNTVPCWIFDEYTVSRMSQKTIFIDLASPPFGLDERLAAKYSLNYIKASGIPGKYSPDSAGDIIGRSVFLILEKEGRLK